MRQTFILAAVLVAVAAAGCYSGPYTPTLDVTAGRPFTAEAGVLYRLPEDGPVYQFNFAEYPGAEIVYVDPDERYRLQAGQMYVFFENPNYQARKARQAASFDRMIGTLNAWGHSFDGMSNMGQGMDSMGHSVDRQIRSNRQTMGILQDAWRRQMQNQRR